ncbi:hypothetical protein F444_13037 [Phytophthora nicotianae P1976]|uniref:Uncharacterized protein n=1 Tax=Phytophthora nicotianae P1976 TaxID=1317066 RepID=A0A080ZV26_PHYNI|nr:hypothetical protein F444_13037 [Phytophthora nicotianae P1976]
MNVEELKALEETLAFFDTPDDPFTRFSSGHSSDESSYNVSAVTDNELVRSGSRSKPNEIHDGANAIKQEIARLKTMKLEIRQLCAGTADLQQRLEELRYSKRATTKNSLEPLAGNAGCFQRSDETRLAAWHGLAMRQKRLRNEAESENEYLRRLIQTQIKTIKSLKRMFHKEALTKRTFSGLSRWINPIFVPEGPGHGFELLEQMSGSLSDLFFDTERVFQSNGLSSIPSPFSQVNTRPLSSSNTRIELLKCDVLPFDYRASAKTFMDKLVTDYETEEEGNHIQANLKQKAARVFTLDIEDDVMKIQLRFMAVKYTEEKREVIVFTGQDELLEVFGVAVDGIKLEERTWCVCPRCRQVYVFFNCVSPGLWKPNHYAEVTVILSTKCAS